MKKGLLILAAALFVGACSRGDAGFNHNPDAADNPTVDADKPQVPDDAGDIDDDVLVPNSQVVSFDNQVKITFLDDGTAAVDNPFADNGLAIISEGGHVIINSDITDTELTYVLSGVTTDGSVKIYGNYKFTLALNGVGITNPKGAAINIQCGKKITVNVVDQTKNRLIDGKTYEYAADEDMKGTFFSEGQLNFYGTGTLEVRGNNKHAICTDDYLRVYDGNIHVKAAASDAIHANDYVRIDGGNLTLRSTGEGVEAEKGYVEIYGGTLDITTTGDKSHGIKSKTYAKVNSNGAIRITTYGSASKGFGADGDMTIENGEFNIQTAGNALYDTDVADISSASGIKCDGNMVVNGGNFTIVSAGKGGKGISVDGMLVINNGSLTVTTTGGQYVYSKNNTAAKAVKSDGNLTINGGTLVIKTYGVEAEGLESKDTLTIRGGNIAVEAYDDGINAANHIQIDGGTIYCASATNDGIDCNGTLTVTGGTVVSVGASGAEEGFDCDNNRFAITGGTLVGIGGATSTPTTSACTQRSLVFGSATANVQIIRIQATSDGAEALTFKLPRTYSQRTVLLFSSAAIANTGYTIYTGGTISGGSDFHGLYTDAVYTAGTAAGTFTASSMVSTVGNVGAGGPGGGRR
jgi:hypothetical protein